MIRRNVDADIDGELRNFHTVVATVSIQFTRKLSKYLNIYEMFSIHSIFYLRKKKMSFAFRYYRISSLFMTTWPRNNVAVA